MRDTGKNIVLIIDDETANIMVLTSILSTEYDVYAAKSGSDAIKLAEENLPDVILLDVLMPEMDGYEVITSLKELDKTKDIPVIFITGLNNPDAEKKGLAMGAADYIPKPFNPDIVKLRVQIQIKLVNHIRALEERDEMERQLNLIRELEAGLIAAKEQAEYSRGIAEHSSRAKSEFLSRMSHEMRTPMNAIMGMLQILKVRGIPDNIKDYINEITTASNHLLLMIDDVLDVTGMEYGVFKLNCEIFNIITAFNDVLLSEQYNASQKDQTLNIKIDPKIPEMLLGDEKRFKQVIANLLANAIKFTEENGEISFSASKIKEESGTVTIEIVVSDTGIGMTEDQQTNLYRLFEQADGSNTRKHGGIGIGLALSKRIIDMMGGSIQVESEPDKGSKFIINCSFNIV